MWILKADRPGTAPVAARPQDLRGRRHLAQDDEDRVVEHARPVSRLDRRGRVGHLHGRHRRRRRRSRALANKKEVLRAKAPECTLEAQDFRNDDTELIYTCYRVAVRRRLRHRPDDRDGHDLPQDRRRVQRGRRHLPGRRVRARRVEPRAAEAELQLHRHLEAEARAEQPDFVRMTRWGDYPGYKASNPVVSPDGRRSPSSRRATRTRQASATASSS